jgi:branched-chain amino acid transport system substrate-binding protein
MDRLIRRTSAPKPGASLAVTGGSAPVIVTADTHVVAQNIELTGAAAEAGDAWRNGVELAVQEINSAGGVLGKPIELVTFDAQSTANGARLAMERALELEPLAVLGPALPDPARGALAVVRVQGTPLILSAAAPEPAGGASHPATFYALPGAATLMARLAVWLRQDAKIQRLAVLWSAHERFRASRDALTRAAREHGIDVAADWVTEALKPADDVARLLTAGPEALLVLLPEAKCGRVIIEARKQAPRVALLGEGSLIGRIALADAGSAAEGVSAHLLLPPDPAADPATSFAGRFLAANKQPPVDLALAGYVAVGMVRAALQRSAAAEPRALADALRGLATSAAHDPMLGDCTWNAAGEPDRASWIVRVQNGEVRKLASLHGGVG